MCLNHSGYVDIPEPCLKHRKDLFYWIRECISLEVFDYRQAARWKKRK